MPTNSTELFAAETSKRKNKSSRFHKIKHIALVLKLGSNFHRHFIKYYVHNSKRTKFCS